MSKTRRHLWEALSGLEAKTAEAMYKWAKAHLNEVPGDIRSNIKWALEKRGKDILRDGIVTWTTKKGRVTQRLQKAMEKHATLRKGATLSWTASTEAGDLTFLPGPYHGSSDRITYSPMGKKVYAAMIAVGILDRQTGLIIPKEETGQPVPKARMYRGSTRRKQGGDPHYGGSKYSDARDMHNDSRNRHPLSWKKLRNELKDSWGIPEDWYMDDSEPWYVVGIGSSWAGPFKSKGHAAEALFKAQRDYDRWMRRGGDYSDPEHYDTWEPSPRTIITTKLPRR